MKIRTIALLIALLFPTTAAAANCPLPPIPPQPQGVAFPAGVCAPGTEWNEPAFPDPNNPAISTQRTFRCFRNNTWILIRIKDSALRCGSVQPFYEVNLYIDEVPVKQGGVVVGHAIVNRGSDVDSVAEFAWGGYVCNPPCRCGLELRGGGQELGTHAAISRKRNTCDSLNQVASRAGVQLGSIPFVGSRKEALQSLASGEEAAAWGQCPDQWNRAPGCMLLESHQRISYIITIAEINGNTEYSYSENAYNSSQEEVRVNPTDICADGSGEARTFSKEEVFSPGGRAPAC